MSIERLKKRKAKSLIKSLKLHHWILLGISGIFAFAAGLLLFSNYNVSAEVGSIHAVQSTAPGCTIILEHKNQCLSGQAKLVITFPGCMEYSSSTEYSIFTENGDSDNWTGNWSGANFEGLSSTSCSNYIIVSSSGTYSCNVTDEAGNPSTNSITIQDNDLGTYSPTIIGDTTFTGDECTVITGTLKGNIDCNLTGYWLSGYAFSIDGVLNSGVLTVLLTFTGYYGTTGIDDRYYTFGDSGFSLSTGTNVQLQWRDSDIMMGTSSIDLGQGTGWTLETGAIELFNVQDGPCGWTGIRITSGYCTSGVSFSRSGDYGAQGSGISISVDDNFDGTGECYILFEDDEGTHTATHTATGTIKFEHHYVPSCTIFVDEHECTSGVINVTLSGTSANVTRYSWNNSNKFAGNRSGKQFTGNGIITGRVYSDYGLTGTCTGEITGYDDTAPTFLTSSGGTRSGYECETGSITITGFDNDCGSGNILYSWNGKEFGNENTYILFSDHTGTQNINFLIKDGADNLTGGTGTFIWNNLALTLTTGSYNIIGYLTGTRTINNIAGNDVFGVTGYGRCETITGHIVSCTGATGSLDDNYNLTLTGDNDYEGSGSCTIEFCDDDGCETGDVNFYTDTKNPTVSLVSQERCTTGKTFVVTGNFNECVTGVVTSSLTGIGGNIEIIGFTKHSCSGYSWTVKLNNSYTGLVQILTGGIFDDSNNPLLNGTSVEIGYHDYYVPFVNLRGISQSGLDTPTMTSDTGTISYRDVKFYWTGGTSGCANVSGYNFYLYKTGASENPIFTDNGNSGFNTTHTGSLDNGTYYRYVIITDEFGRTGRSEIYYFTINTTTPTCTISRDSCSNTGVTVTLSGTNENSWVSWSGTDRVSGPITTGVTVENATITGYVINSGNGLTGTCSATITGIDNTAPTVTGGTFTGYECERITGYIDANDTGCAGNSLIYWFKTGSDWFSLNNSGYGYILSITGSRIFSGKVSDNNSNSGNSVAITYIWDDTGVTVSHTGEHIGELSNTWTSSTDVIAWFNAREGNCGSEKITAVLSGSCTGGTGTLTGANTGLQIEPEPNFDGTGECTIVFRDDDGKSESVKVTFTVKKTLYCLDNWDNDYFLTGRFWDGSDGYTGWKDLDSEHQRQALICALYGSGADDPTAYTTGWYNWDWSNDCDVLDMAVVTGFKIAGESYSFNENTIYVLTGNINISDGNIALKKCSAIVTSGGYTISRSSNNPVIKMTDSFTILDNLSTRGGSTGIYIYGSGNKTLNLVRQYNATEGVRIESENTVLNNMQIFNNNSVGINFVSGSYNSLNNTQIYNNTFGTKVNGSGNLINNVIIYNNGEGLIINENRNFFNDISIYNNETGIEFANNVSGIFYGTIKYFGNTNQIGYYQNNGNMVRNNSLSFLFDNRALYATGEKKYDLMTKPITKDHNYFGGWDFEYDNFIGYSGSFDSEGNISSYSYGSGIALYEQAVALKQDDIAKPGKDITEYYIGSLALPLYADDTLPEIIEGTTFDFQLTGDNVSQSITNYSLFGDIVTGVIDTGTYEKVEIKFINETGNNNLAKVLKSVENYSVHSTKGVETQKTLCQIIQLQTGCTSGCVGVEITGTSTLIGSYSLNGSGPFVRSDINTGCVTGNIVTGYIYKKGNIPNKVELIGICTGEITGFDNTPPTVTGGYFTGYECTTITGIIHATDTGCIDNRLCNSTLDYNNPPHPLHYNRSGLDWLGWNSYYRTGLYSDIVTSGTYTVYVTDSAGNQNSGEVMFEWFDDPLTGNRLTGLGIIGYNGYTVNNWTGLFSARAGSCEDIIATGEIICSSGFYWSGDSTNINSGMIMPYDDNTTYSSGTCTGYITDGDTTQTGVVTFTYDTTEPSCSISIESGCHMTGITLTMSFTNTNSYRTGETYDRIDRGLENSYSRTVDSTGTYTGYVKHGNRTGFCTGIVTEDNLDQLSPTFNDTPNTFTGYECENIYGYVSATDSGCASDTLIYSRSGNYVWNPSDTIFLSGENLTGFTYTGGNRSGTNVTGTLNVYVSDSLGNSGNSTQVNFVWLDTGVTLTTGSITGIILTGNNQFTGNAFELFGPNEGNCGSGYISITNVSCSGNNVLHIATGGIDGYDISISGDSLDATGLECYVVFSDDDENYETGTIIIDLHTTLPTCTLTVESSICTSGEVTLILSGLSDNITGYQWFEISDNWLRNRTGKAYTGVFSNRHYTGYVVDIYGNTGECSTGVTNYDDTAPTTDSGIIFSGEYECTTGTLNFENVTDTNCGSGNIYGLYSWYTEYSSQIFSGHLWNNPHEIYLGRTGNIEYIITGYLYDGVGNTTGEYVKTGTIVNILPTSTGEYYIGTISSTTGVIDLVTTLEANEGVCGTGDLVVSDYVVCTNATGTINTENNTYNLTIEPKLDFEGTGECTVIFVDNEGSQTGSKIIFNTDTSAPTCTIEKSTGACTSGAIELTLSVSGTEFYSWTGFGTTGNYTGYTVTKNGIYTGYVRDNVGHTGLCTENIDNIDIWGPSVTVSKWTGFECQTGSITALGTDDDCGSGKILYSWSGGNFTDENTYKKNSQRPGILSIPLSVMDSINNITTLSEYPTFTWDDSGVSVRRPEYSGYTLNTTNRIDFTATGAITLFDVIDGDCGWKTISVTGRYCTTGARLNRSEGPADGFGSGFEIISSGNAYEGDGYCEIYFEDDEGNPGTGKILFYTDTKIPICNVIFDKNICTTGEISLSLTGNDLASGHRANGEWTGIDHTIMTVTENGIYTGFVSDAAGNTGYCTGIIEGIDRDGPEISGDNFEITGYECTNLTINITATDSGCTKGSGIRYLRSGINVWDSNNILDGWEQPWKFTYTGGNRSGYDVTGTISIVAKDILGNTGTERYATFVWYDTGVTLKTGEITGVILSGLNTLELGNAFALFGPKEGDCGDDYISISAVSCEYTGINIATGGTGGRYIYLSGNVQENTGDIVCHVVFVDDDDNFETGDIIVNLFAQQPSCTLTVENNKCTSGEVTLILSGLSDNITGYQWFDYNNSWNNNRTGKAYTGVSDNGIYTGYVVDIYGNTGECSTGVTNINREPPESEHGLYLTGTFECTERQIAFSGLVSGSGCNSGANESFYAWYKIFVNNNVLDTGWVSYNQLIPFYIGRTGNAEYIATGYLSDSSYNTRPYSKTGRIEDIPPTASGEHNLGIISGAIRLDNLVTILDAKEANLNGDCGTGDLTVSGYNNSGYFDCSNATGYITGSIGITIEPKPNFEGTGECTVKFVDNEGSRTGSRITFEIDTKAPECIITYNTGICTSGDIEITLSGLSNDITGYQWFEYNNNLWNYGWTGQTSIGTTGNGIVTGYVKDNAGNIGYCTGNITTYDNSNPTFDVSNNGKRSGYECETGSITITGSDDDCGSGKILYSWDGGSIYSGINTYLSGSDKVGSGDIYFLVKDGADNLTGGTGTFIWNNLALHLSRDSYDIIGYLTGTKTINNISGNDVFGVTGYGRCETITGHVVSCTGATGSLDNNFNLTLTGDNDYEGSGSCTIKFCDDDGCETGTITFDIDTSAPTCEITRNIEKCTSGDIQLTMITSGATKYSRTGRSDMVDTTGYFYATGNNTYYCYVQDENGNTGMNQISIKNHDSSVPTIINIQAASGYECKTITGYVTAGDTDCGSGDILYSWSGGNFGGTTNHSEYSDKVLTKTISLSVKDSVGNTTTTGVQYTWNDVKTTIKNPDIDLGTINKTYTTGNIINVFDVSAGDCEDITTDLERYYSSNNCSLNNNMLTINVPDNTEGSGQCVLKFKDDDNNIVTGTIKFYVDSKKPKCNLTIVDNNTCSNSGVLLRLEGNSSDISGYHIEHTNIEDTNWLSWGSEIEYTAIDTGEYIAYVIDKNNNTGSCSVTVSDSVLDKQAPYIAEDYKFITGYECEKLIGEINATDTGCDKENQLFYDWGGVMSGWNLKYYSITRTGVSTETINVTISDTANNISSGSIEFAWLDIPVTLKEKTISLNTPLSGQTTIVGLKNDYNFLPEAGNCEVITMTLLYCTNNVSGYISGTDVVLTPNAGSEGETGYCNLQFCDDDGCATGTLKYSIVKYCGDGKVLDAEECDLGVNNSNTGICNTECKWTTPSCELTSDETKILTGDEVIFTLTTQNWAMVNSFVAGDGKGVKSINHAGFTTEEFKYSYDVLGNKTAYVTVSNNGKTGTCSTPIEIVKPGLNVDKNVNPAEGNMDTEMKFTIVVENKRGKEKRVNVFDILPDGFECDTSMYETTSKGILLYSGYLGTGEKKEFIITGHATQEGVFSNTTRVYNDKRTIEDEDSVNYTIGGYATYSIRKYAVKNPVHLYDEVEFIIEYKNTSDNTGYNISIIDYLPNSISGYYEDAQAVQNGTIVTLAKGLTLAPGQTGHVSIKGIAVKTGATTNTAEITDGTRKNTAYTNLIIKSSGICGNGIKEDGEYCDNGENNGKIGYCSKDCNEYIPDPEKTGHNSIVGVACKYNDEQYLSRGSFTDTYNHRGFNYIENMRLSCLHRGKMTKRGLWEYRPDDDITRAEVLKTLVKIRGIAKDDFTISSEDTLYIGNQIFADVPKNYWFSRYAEYAYNMGMTDELYATIGGQKYFVPDGPISRNEIIKKVMILYYELENSNVIQNSATKLVDVSSSSPYYKYIRDAESLGIISGVDNIAGGNQWQGSRSLTRAEFAKIVSNAFGDILFEK